MVKKKNRYVELSLKSLDEAEKMIKEGNHHNASEKLWGAAAHITKAVAEKKGWKHKSHLSLFNVVDKLEEETRDTELGYLFTVSSALHQNFYENWMTKRQVEKGAEAVKRFIKKMKKYGV